MPLGLQVKVTGPVMTGKGGRILDQATQGAIEELVDMGMERLDQTLRPRPSGVFLSVAQAGRGKASTGHYRRNLHQKVTHRHGLISDGGVVYGPWLEGVSSRNQTTRFKGYASFRRVQQFLNKEAGKVLQKQVAKAARKLGGR